MLTSCTPFSLQGDQGAMLRSCGAALRSQVCAIRPPLDGGCIWQRLKVPDQRMMRGGPRQPVHGRAQDMRRT
jgi:hypothetical protein